jgi:hypothetical protein
MVVGLVAVLLRFVLGLFALFMCREDNFADVVRRIFGD